MLQELGVVEQVAQLMQYADVCWRMLAYADACRLGVVEQVAPQMQALSPQQYADVCGRMLTCAGGAADAGALAATGPMMLTKPL